MDDKAVSAQVRTPERFWRWLETAKPGQVVCYHAGNLAADRGCLGFVGSKVVYLPIEPLNTFASLVYLAYENGEIVLLQARLGPGECAYLAVKR